MRCRRGEVSCRGWCGGGRRLQSPSPSPSRPPRSPPRCCGTAPPGGQSAPQMQPGSGTHLRKHETVQLHHLIAFVR